MTRLLYVGRSAGVHDDRFIQAWRDAGLSVSTAFVDDEVGAGFAELQCALSEEPPDVVQVGPLTVPGALVAAMWDGALIGTSWAFDLQQEAKTSETACRLAKLSLQRADLLFVDNNVTESIALTAGVPPNAIVQFPWGVEGHWLHSPIPPKPSPRAPIYLCVRNHEPLYRVHDVIRAFHATRAQGDGAQLWLAGTGRETAQLRALAERLGVDQQVRWLGRLTGRGLRQAYADADVYISASETDGSSVSLLEAMASNTPSVVSNVRGNQQWIDETTGWQFGVGDVTGLATILDLFNYPDSAIWSDIQARVSMARSRVVHTADWERTSSRFAEYAAMAVARSRQRLGES